MKPSYQELLRRPEWDAKRKYILRRDNWQCLNCNTTNEEMHVHHIYYKEDGSPPWEYDDEDLFTLCGTCHFDEEIYKSTRLGMLDWAACNGLLYLDMNIIFRKLTKAIENKSVEEKRHIIVKYINYLP